MAHPNKHVRKAIRFAEQRGWTLKLSKGHPYGILRCPRQARDGHSITVMSTPRNPENHADDIVTLVATCDCYPTGEGSKEEGE